MRSAEGRLRLLARGGRGARRFDGRRREGRLASRTGSISRRVRGANRSTPASEETRGLLRLYVDRLNQRDWDGLRELVSNDARVGVADRYAGSAAQAPYFARFSQRSMPWRASLAEIDGELAVVVHTRSRDGEAWTPQTIVRFDVVDGRIAALIDYNHCPWVLASAAPIAVVE